MKESISNRLPDPEEPMLSRQQDEFLLEIYEKAKWMDREEFMTRKSFVMELMRHHMVQVRRNSRDVDDESFIVGLSVLGDDYIKKRLNPILHFESADGLVGETTLPGLKPPPQRWERPVRPPHIPRFQNVADLNFPQGIQTRVYGLHYSERNHHWYKEIV